MNWKEFGRKQLQPNKGTMKFAGGIGKNYEKSQQG
jgi:hypothetical protein